MTHRLHDVRKVTKGEQYSEKEKGVVQTSVNTNNSVCLWSVTFALIREENVESKNIGGLRSDLKWEILIIDKGRLRVVGIWRE